MARRADEQRMPAPSDGRPGGRAARPAAPCELASARLPSGRVASPGTAPLDCTAMVDAAAWTRSPVLQGERVLLEPLDERHVPGLLAAAAADPAIWTWLFARLDDEGALRAWLADALRARDAGTEVPFATLDAKTGRVVGSTRYLAVVPAHRRLEIGWTWLAPAAWGTGINVEAKLLLLAHAFDELGAMRVELKTDARNERSRAAILALGARFEGIFRKHMQMADGRIRDSAWYSITDDDWPAVRSRLEARLEAPRGPAGGIATSGGRSLIATSTDGGARSNGARAARPGTAAAARRAAPRSPTRRRPRGRISIPTTAPAGRSRPSTTTPAASRSES